MEERHITTTVRCVGFEELDAQCQQLVNVAKEATRSAYAPFSKFRVGAAILMENGEIVTGSNQENAAFPAGICAERAACFYASSHFPDVPMKKIAIAAWTISGHKPGTPFEECFQRRPVSPCGVCRQALMEYERLYGPIEVILYGSDEIYILPSVASLLPLSFTEF